MRQQWLLVVALLLGTGSCKQVLGIDERSLDVTTIGAQGYDGCRPASGLCDGCTSAWHTCVCEGWDSTPEVELRNACAPQAPESIRAEVLQKAAEVYNLYVSDLDAEGYDGCSPDADECDECLSGWHECLCDGWGSAPIAELEWECSELAPAPVRSDVRERAQDRLDESDGDGGSESDESASDDDQPNPDDTITDDDAISKLPVFNDEFCVAVPPGDDCRGCFCGECGPQITECQGDFGCAEILDCFLALDCDPTASAGPEACTLPAFCADRVEAHGGEGGTALAMVRETLNCATEKQCPCGDGMNSSGCTPDDSCTTCSDCWARCFCEGKNDSTCKSECGSAQCQPSEGCSQCNDCLDQCFCEGLGDRSYCMNSCHPGGFECAPEFNCNCNNCLDACLCTGTPLEQCTAECGAAGEPACTPMVSCDSCTTCGGQCFCNDPERVFSECMMDCGIEGCRPGDCSSCASCQSECECNGGDPAQCLEDCTGGFTCEAEFLTDCERCSCDRCTDIFAECELHETCVNLMYCIEQTGCRDTYDCSKPDLCGAEVEALGGTEHPLMGVVEALNSCRLSSGCACQGSAPPIGPPPAMICDGQNCDSFVPPPPDVIAGACCAGPDARLCGLDAGPFFGPGYDLECLQRNRPGSTSDQCPSLRPSLSPWNGAEELLGCCTPDSRCGYMDRSVGLGCIAAHYFGIPASDVVSCVPAP